MFLTDIHITECRNLKDVHLTDLPRPKGTQNAVVVLAGANGTGKSTVLDAITSALAKSYGYKFEWGRQEPPYKYSIRIELSESDLAVCQAFIREQLLSIEEGLKAAGSRQASLLQQKEQLEAAGNRLSTEPYYLRTNMPGVDAAEIAVSNKIHNVVSSCSAKLGNLGFYISADRSYRHQQYSSPYWKRASWVDRDSPQYLKTLSFRTHQYQFQDLHDYIIDIEDKVINRLEEIAAELRRCRDDSARIAILKAEQDDLLHVNPSEPYVNLFNEVLAPLTLLAPDPRNSQNVGLQVMSPFSPQPYNLMSMSNGEKEAFFLSAFFLRQSVRESIVSIDEPEVHLHPELARRLMRRFSNGRDGNQIWLATHNAEIINEAPLSSIRFFEKSDTGTVVTRPDTDDERAAAFRSILGSCGYCLLDQCIVFIEGDSSSLDKELYDALGRSLDESIKFVPVGDCESATSLNRVTLDLLGQTVKGVSFCSIRDRDYYDEAALAAMTARFRDAVWVLPCHEVENLLLDPKAIHTVLSSKYFNRSVTVGQLSTWLHEAAVGISGEVVRDMAVFRMRRALSPQDYSLGDAFRATDVFGSSRLPELRTAFLAKTSAVARDVENNVGTGAAEATFDLVASEVKSWLWRDDGSMNSDYLQHFPGKQLLREFLFQRDIKGEVASVFGILLAEEVGRNPRTPWAQETLSWIRARTSS